MKTKILQNTLFSFGLMLALAITAHAQNLYVSISGDEAIFEYTPAGIQSTYASGLGFPRGVAFDVFGNLVLAEFFQPQDIHFDGKVLKFNPRNKVSTIGNASNSLFEGLATDSVGNVFVVGEDTFKKSPFVSVIFKFTPSGDRILFASIPGQGWGLAFDRAGNLYAAVDDYLGDSNDQTIFKFAPDGTRTVVVGPSAFAAGAYLIGLAFDSSGNLFVSTTTFGNPGTDAVVKFTPTGFGSSFASGLTNARGLAFDASGNLFVTEASPAPDGDILKFAPGGGTPTVFASGLRRPQFLTFGPPR